MCENALFIPASASNSSSSAGVLLFVFFAAFFAPCSTTPRFLFFDVDLVESGSGVALKRSKSGSCNSFSDIVDSGRVASPRKVELRIISTGHSFSVVLPVYTACSASDGLSLLLTRTNATWGSTSTSEIGIKQPSKDFAEYHRVEGMQSRMR